ncbi:MAG: ABC transporter substrate-binding protein [Deinococcales bacterium]
MERRLTVLTAFGVVLAISGLAQNVPNTDPKKGNPNLRGEISVFSWSEPSYSSVLADFNKLYPNIKVKFVTVGYTDAYPRITASLAGNVPLADVVMIESERVEIYGTRFPNAFTDLSAWGGKWERNFDRSKWAQSVVKGKLITMPTDAAPVGMWYRADMFEKAGVNPTGIRTWADYLEAGKKVIAANPGVRMAGIDVNGSETLLRILIQQQNSFYVDQEGRIAVNSSKMNRALSFVKSAWDAGILANVQGTDGLIGAFKTNRIATINLPVWMIGIFKGFAPEQRGKWGVVQIPALTAGGGQSAYIGGSSLAIPANSQNKEAAWAFVEWYTTYGSKNVLEKRGAWPSFLPSLSAPILNTPDNFFATPNVFAPFRKSAFLGRPLRYSSDYDKAFGVVVAAQASVLTGGQSVQAALDKAAKDLQNATGRAIAPK